MPHVGIAGESARMGKQQNTLKEEAHETAITANKTSAARLYAEVIRSRKTPVTSDIREINMRGETLIGAK